MIAVALLVVAGIPGAGSADAFWRSSGRGVGSALTGTLNAPTGVTVPANSSSTVAVSWSASAGPTTPTGYYVTRTTGTTTTAACGSSATALLTATSCSDTGVAPGTYTYAVTAVFRTWSAKSAASGSVVVAAATKLVYSRQPTDSIAGTSVTPSVVVGLQTAAGVNVTTAGITITIAIAANPAAGTLSGTLTSVTNSSGVADFPGLSIDKAGSGYTLIASGAGLTSATTTTFTIAPASASRLAFTSAPVTAAASSTTNAGVITVQRQDAFGNAVTSTSASTLTLSSSSTGTSLFAPTSGTAAAAVSIPASGSTASFFYGDTRAGSPVITAALSGLTSATQTETITAATATKLVFSSAATSAVASATTNGSALTVQRQDAFGNPAPVAATTALTLSSNTTGTAVFAPTSGAAGASVSFAAGSNTATFFYGDTRAGSPVITAALTGLTSATQSETVTAGAVTTLTFDQQPPASTPSAVAFSPAIRVKAVDAFGNPTSATVTLTIENNPSLLGRLYNASNQIATITVTTDATTGLGTYTGVKIAGLALNLGAAGTGYTLRAASGSVSVISGAFTITGLL